MNQFGQLLAFMSSSPCCKQDDMNTILKGTYYTYIFKLTYTDEKVTEINEQTDTGSNHQPQYG